MNSEYITFDLYLFNRYIQLLNKVSKVSILIKNNLAEIRGHFDNSDSNILSIVLNENNIFEVNSEKEAEDIFLLFTINISSLDIIKFLEIGTITFYVNDDYIKINVTSTIKVDITTDNLYTYDFLELHNASNYNESNIYQIDKNILHCIYTILTHKDKSKIYLKINKSTLYLQFGNNTEFTILENIINEEKIYKFKLNFDTFIDYLSSTLINNICIGNYKILFNKDRPLIIFNQCATCKFYLFMAPFEN